MLGFAKTAIDDRYKIDKGCDFDCSVVYGDTDSLFVRVKNATVKQAIDLGHKISTEVSELFSHEVLKLVFEKVYLPYILINRKRYAGLKWTKPTCPDQIDEKGIESQRRDSCGVLKTVMSHVIGLLMTARPSGPQKEIGSCEKDRYEILEGVEKYLKNVIEKILKGELNPGEFVLTKGLWLGTEAEDYKGKQQHVELVAKLRNREPERVFRDGDRISFVYTKQGTKGFEKAEDVLYTMKNEIPLDYAYYVRHQLEAPLTRIMELLYPSSRIHHIFHGDHTLVSQNPSKSLSKQSSLSSFFTTKQHSTCILCKSKIRDTITRFVCDECKNNNNDVMLAAYLKFVDRTNSEIQKATTAVSICRQCQGLANREVICTNTDCTVFYRRWKYTRDAAKDVKQLISFEKGELEF